MKHMSLLTASVLLCCLQIGASEKLRVYVLAGGKNADGKAALDHLKERIDTDLEQQKHNQYTSLVNDDGTWRSFDSAFVTFAPVRHERWVHGPVSAGANFSHDPDSFGPELGISAVLTKAYTDPIIIVKCTWPGKTLNEDFRPPSSGGVTGFQWFNMWNLIEQTMHKAHEVVGQEFSHLEPELRGMVWFHGYEDILHHDSRFNYETNLINFVKDFRARAGNPFLPVAIGELGGTGNGEIDPLPPREMEMRRIQHKVATLPENERTTMFVKTSHYVHPYDPRFDVNTHYYGLGDTMVDIGQAFADALIELDDRYEEILSEQEREAEIFSIGSSIQLMSLLFFAGIGMYGYVLYKKSRENTTMKQTLYSVFSFQRKAKHEDGGRAEVVDAQYA